MSAAALHVALVGNPNSGKTALFNRLTGSRQKVANYAGVTVERKEGRFTDANGRVVRVLDLPGTYSLAATSPDEAITRDVCLGRLRGEARPDLLLCVADATNLRLHLRFVLEVRQLGLPMVLALNCADLAEKRGIRIDLAKLEAALGIPVVQTVAVQTGGAQALVKRLSETLPPAPLALPAGSDLHQAANAILAEAITMPRRTAAVDDALDRVLLHPVWGLTILAVVMFLIFQAVFSWAEPLMGGIEAITGLTGEAISATLPEGLLKSLLVDGIVAGVGGVIVFLPQILILFLFILALEESGYLPRAAFLLDRFMVGAGLTGRSFIPLLSSFACAIPGVMAARTIQDPRDRLSTILVAPLMTCSARLPIYALLIGAFIPQQAVWGVFNLQGVVLFVLYVAGIVSALAVAAAMKWWRARRGGSEAAEHSLLLELPSYRLPSLYGLALGLWERAAIFVKRVGGVILALTVILWVLSTFPAPPVGAVGPAIDYSFAGRIGHFMEPFFAPIGFNWQICIALIPGLAAREVAVGALATVYAISAETEEAVTEILASAIGAQWGLPTALSLLAWYVFAPQCLSTLATIRRETSNRVMWLATAYLFGLAYLAAFVTYQLASL